MDWYFILGCIIGLSFGVYLVRFINAIIKRLER